MSIDFSLKLKGNLANESVLINEINKWGGDIQINKSSDEKNILVIDSIYELLGFNITLIRNKKPPYNVYESCLLGTDFEYNQVILFGINKEANLSIVYGTVLELCFDLVKKLNTNALLTSSVHDEICYFDDDKNIRINTEVELVDLINNILNINTEWNCIYN